MTHPPKIKTRIKTHNARLWQPGLLEQGSLVSLSAEASHHARSVLRIQAGERLLLFNEQHGEWLAEITGWRHNVGEAICQERVRAASAGACEKNGAHLYFSPIRPHRLSLLLTASVELGVSRLLPYRSAYSVARFSRARAQRVVISAVEQSQRLCCPIIAEEQDLQAKIFEHERIVLFCAERGARHSLPQAIADCAKKWDNIEQNVAVLIGPEGGFSPEEHAMLRACPRVVPISLGSRVLRCETAALAVLACWQLFAGNDFCNSLGNSLGESLGESLACAQAMMPMM